MNNQKGGISAGLTTAFSVVGVGVVTLLLLVVWWTSTSNREVRLRNELSAEQDNSKITFDQMFKVIQQQFGVAESSKDAFKEVYQPLMEAQNQKDSEQLLGKFLVQAQVPVADFTRLYEKVSTSVEVQRGVFAEQQRKLRSKKTEHDNLRTTFPSSIVVGDRPEIVVQLVTSSKTEQSFQTGKEDNINLK